VSTEATPPSTPTHTPDDALNLIGNVIAGRLSTVLWWNFMISGQGVSLSLLFWLSSVRGTFHWSMSIFIPILSVWLALNAIPWVLFFVFWRRAEQKRWEH
jgi:hypothetical protein